MTIPAITSGPAITTGPAITGPASATGAIEFGADSLTLLPAAAEAVLEEAVLEEAVPEEAAPLGTDRAAHEESIAQSKHGQAKHAQSKQAQSEQAQSEQAQSEQAQAKHDPYQAGQRWSKGLDWTNVIWIGAIHVGLLAAPFFFTFKALALMAFLHWMTGGIGVCLGYHRQLTHGSFSTYRPVRWLLAMLGGLSGEGSAITWVANHRKHHAFSDQEGDPHSPHDGGLWSHMLWFMPKFGKKYYQELHDRYAPDLARDPGMHLLHKMFLPNHLALGALLLTIGYFGWDLHTGISFVVWGMFVRLIGVLHVTWFVNSATHLWGYRNYETSDDSRNLWWVGLLAYGEGWHNNHHAFQRMARHGHRWWEIDMTYWAICLMEKLGLAWDVVHDVPARRKLAG